MYIQWYSYLQKKYKMACYACNDPFDDEHTKIHPDNAKGQYSGPILMTVTLYWYITHLNRSIAPERKIDEFDNMKDMGTLMLGKCFINYKIDVLFVFPKIQWTY